MNGCVLIENYPTSIYKKKKYIYVYYYNITNYLECIYNINDIKLSSVAESILCFPSYEEKL